jgi:hypothetical protein
MSAFVVSIAAVRTARVLRANAPVHRIDDFLARMTQIARQQRDTGREAFWHEVAMLVDRESRWVS